MGRNKIGRNEACPCGSGQKYKNCCLRKDQDAPFARAGISDPLSAGLRVIPEWPRWSMFTPSAAEQLARMGFLGDIDFHPWIVAQLREWSGIGVGGRPPLVTISSVRAMETRTLFEGLARFGVQIDEAGFREAAADHTSAWELSEAWDLAPAADPEWVGLATCELWRRLLFARPSLEMLDERMQAGYAALDAGDSELACRLWLSLWADLLRILPATLTTLDEANAIFPGLNSLSNWEGDFKTELYNASLRDPVIARHAVALYERLTQRFQASSYRSDTRRELAELLYLIGERARAEALLEAVIEEYPTYPGGYACLSDHLGGDRHGPEYQDIDRAIQILERALAVPVDDPADWDIQARLDDLRTARRSL